MGFVGTTMCFSTDTFVMDYEITTLASAIKKDFVLKNSSFVPLPRE